MRYSSMFEGVPLKRCVVLIGVVFISFLCTAQKPTPAEERLKGFERHRFMKENTIMGSVRATSIGPSVFSCRVTDVEVNPADPTEIYVAYASGGVWHSTNNGTTFKPIFDQEATMTIGDIAVDWQRRIIWVGTGESNSSRSSYAGTGIYYSSDNGKTWEWRGLPESHHIGRILLHPKDPSTLWVAVVGHLYSPNPERGVYRSIDGGRTWQRTLFIDENTGAIDLCLDPQNPNVIYAATWQRERRAWNFVGAGEGSAIWKSVDGGATWGKLTVPGSGFPSGANTGRIGLCAGLKDGKTILYACVDNQNPKPKKEKPPTDALTKEKLRTMSVAAFLQLADEQIDTFLRENRFPEKYSAKKIKELVQKGQITPQTLVEYLEDANAQLFEVDYIGAEVYRSEDGGRTWKRTHDEPLEQMNFSYGYYFSNIRCQPNDADKVYLLGFYLIRSDDGGRTWRSINGDNVHVDHHALWVNPSRPGHLVNGNDGGLNISWDDGESWIKCNQPPVGQFYAVAVDDAQPYRVYGGTQDNGVWVGPSTYQASTSWHQTGQYPYQSLLGGDGMQVAIDPRTNDIIYTGYQFGNYFRIEQKTGKRKAITPKHDLGERPPRFNWQTPIHLSVHQPDVLYLGAHKLYRSFNRGDDWEAISEDLTRGGRVGNVPYGTLTTISESPLKFGLLYVGSDDGLLHVTRDGGDTWTRISDSLPPNLWVSRVVASAHQKSRVYVSLNGYRWDDFTPYLYVSENYGATWERLGTDLPLEPINVVREDPENPNVLYVGTDAGAYVSVDRGKTFHALCPDFPTAPVHDIAIQKRARELILGTHGRSLYRVNIAHIQQLTPDVLAKTIHVFEMPKIKYQEGWGKKQPWRELKDPELPVTFYVATAGKVSWTVKTKDGISLNSGQLNCRAGLNSLTYTLDVQEAAVKRYQKALQEAQKHAKKTIELAKADTGKFYLQKGSYLFEMQKDGSSSTVNFIIE
ncbi:MAG: glycosyl hydrolase [Saprospiraceae bacterium]|nr:glycosyl hydrolase [Saprospiraceae bacterium]MDW8483528.1 glycosyl hydrolase [Saprospiraceae bacterium]